MIISVARTVWVDDDGSGLTGTVIDNAELQAIYDAIEFGMIGEVLQLGGDVNEQITLTAYPSGAGGDKVHHGTRVWPIDSALLPGTYVLEGMGLAQVGTTLTLALVNLTDAPDTPLVTFTITATTPTRGQSGTITFAIAGAAKTYGVKAKIDTGIGFAWGLNIRRIA